MPFRRTPFRPLAAALAAALLLVPTFAAAEVVAGSNTATELAAGVSPAAEAPRSAIFVHPDGMGANTWSATRLLHVGPDGRLAWDQLPAVAIYVGPSLDAVEQSSNGGATTHAYGVRARLASFGQIDGQVPVAASGQRLSLMREAQAAGKAVALINTAAITEPGTAVFLASVPRRGDYEAIAVQLLEARPEILLGGGERFFLPRGVQGRHGPGMRRDGRNLVEEARAAGYAVVFTREELAALPADVTRVFGLFASEDTFNEMDEAGLAAARLQPFQPQAPRVDEMLAFALERLRGAPQGYFIVAEEEATDNLSGENNAIATLEAAIGADRAIALALAEAKANPALTVVVASDSDNGGMNATSDDLGDPADPPRRLPRRTEGGSPIDGDPSGRPFLAAPDRHGVRLPFYVTWSSDSDSAGGTVVRGIGPGAGVITGTVDATAVYHALHAGLFGGKPDQN
jgi:alkaline phosphatase